mgnify:CR=1 FL=1
MKRNEFLKVLCTIPVGILSSKRIYGNPGESRTRRILIEAHRGNSFKAPENTLTAIKQAVETGVDRVEIDLQLSKDHKPVVIHDDTVDRTTNGTGSVSDLTYSQLKKLDAGSWKGSQFKGLKIPSLAETFDMCKGKSMVNIDLKNTAAIPYMMRVIADMKMEDQVVITGKVPASVESIRATGTNPTMFYESTPKFKNLISAGHYKQAIDYAVADARYYALPGFLFNANWVSPDIVYRAHLHGLAVNVWDVNTAETLNKMLEAGVDAIMTDHPATMKQLLQG